MEPPFDDAAAELRKQIGEIGEKVRSLMKHSAANPQISSPSSNDGEMKANIMLSFRHLEDARMRLGKAIQAYDGGVSVYDR